MTVLTDLLHTYREDLDVLRGQDRLRVLKAVEHLDGVQCKVNGRKAINFSSNDYLGLAQDDRLKKAAIEATQKFGTGSGSSRLIAGSSALTQSLEQAIAGWKGTEASLVFNSGYQANVAIAQALFENAHVFADKLNHASLVDGMQLAGAKWTRYAHLDMSHLEEKLKKVPVDARKWIVTDSLFSMDGDYGNLSALCTLAEKYNALILIDEAHAAGVFGNNKAGGIAEAYSVSDRIALQMGTFSKALGGFGAYVAGSQVLIDTLVNKARGFIYSTALPPGVLAAAKTAVDLIQTDRTMKDALWKNIHHMNVQMAAAGFQKSMQPTQIVPVTIGEDAEAMRIMEALLDAGYFVQGVRPPTVPEGSARLRISLSARHTEKQINALVKALSDLV